MDHATLRVMLTRRLRERRLLQLRDRLIASFAHSPGKGLPIGALTSQYLGNFYLDPVDHWAQQTVSRCRYLRYMDDLLSQQEHARQPEQEQRVPGLSGPRHESVRLTDDAFSCARPDGGWDETRGKTPPPADICPRGMEKGGGGAPIQRELPL